MAMDKGHKILIGICVLLLAGCVMLGLMVRDYKRDAALDPLRDQILKDQIAASEARVDSLATAAGNWERKANSLKSEIAALKKGSKSKENYNENLVEFRTLPRDKHAEFFAKELSRVDSIAEW